MSLDINQIFSAVPTFYSFSKCKEGVRDTKRVKHINTKSCSFLNIMKIQDCINNIYKTLTDASLKIKIFI